MRCRKRMPLFQGNFKQNVPSSWSSSSGPSVFSMWNCISEKKRIISAEMGRIPHRNSEPTRHLERHQTFFQTWLPVTWLTSRTRPPLLSGRTVWTTQPTYLDFICFKYFVFQPKKVQSLSFLTVSVLESKGKRRKKKRDASRFHF